MIYALVNIAPPLTPSNVNSNSKIKVCGESTKQICLTITEKLKIAERINLGQSYAFLLQKFNVKVGTLSRIEKNPTALKTVAEKNALSKTLKAVPLFVQPPTDYTVVQFVFFCRQGKNQ